MKNKSFFPNFSKNQVTKSNSDNKINKLFSFQQIISEIKEALVVERDEITHLAGDGSFRVLSIKA